MTSTVTIAAHTNEETEVRITIKEDNKIYEDFIIQDGREVIRSVHGNRTITVREVLKCH